MRTIDSPRPFISEAHNTRTTEAAASVNVAVHLDVATLGLPYGLGVSIPQTRGYIANGGDSATLWSRPPGEVPTALLAWGPPERDRAQCHRLGSRG